MRYYEGHSTFSFSWDKVARAYWCRYPNPWSKHVLSEDVIHRHVDEQGRLVTKRLLSKTNKSPKWAERFLNTRSVYIVEETIVDPAKKTFVTYTKNISSQNMMTIEEKVTYKFSPESTDVTLVEREAWVNSNFGYGLSRAVQAFGFERFKSNVVKASHGYQIVLDAMFNPQAASAKYDANSIANLHPALTAKLREQAKNLRGLGDKAKQKAAPIVAAAMPGERH